jgi:hypothetical protein
VLIIDEAQNLSADVLEQMRLLTNLETNERKLLQIILIGQPELRELLDQPELRQLAQRITGRYHLSPLSPEESAGYVKHRMRIAGATAEVFTPSALREIHRLSGGIPRVINVICDRALLGAFTQEDHRAGAALVRQAASEVYGRPVPAPWLKWATTAAVAAAVGLLAVGLWTYVSQRPDAPATETGAGQPPEAAVATTAPGESDSVAAASDNLLIYATSNRRHLMPERMSENLAAKHTEDGEIHPGETSEEKISLSERFGLWVAFYPFRQDEYLAVVEHWLRHFGCSGAQIEAARADALRWALERGSRSGRVAWQFARDWAGRTASAPRRGRRPAG